MVLGVDDPAIGAGGPPRRARGRLGKPSPKQAFAAAAVFGASAFCAWADPAGAARCVAFEAAGVPFYACVSNWPGGFRLSAGGQASVGALRVGDESGPFLLLSMDYEEGDRVGAWTAATDFVVTLRWDGAGPRRDTLAAEFCAPGGPVPVRVHFEGPPQPRSCGQWTTLLDGLAFPSSASAAAAAERRRR